MKGNICLLANSSFFLLGQRMGLDKWQRSVLAKNILSLWSKKCWRWVRTPPPSAEPPKASRTRWRVRSLSGTTAASTTTRTPGAELPEDLRLISPSESYRVYPLKKIPGDVPLQNPLAPHVAPGISDASPERSRLHHSECQNKKRYDEDPHVSVYIYIYIYI